MRPAAVAALVAIVTACSEPAEEPEIDIEQMNEDARGPAVPIELQVIGYPDIEKYELFGASCAFSPEGGGLGAVVLAMQEGGYLKIDGRIEKFAPDAGSAEQPYGTRSKHDGLERSFELEIDQEAGKQSGYETINYPATLTVRDASDREVYRSDGMAQCGA